MLMPLQIMGCKVLLETVRIFRLTIIALRYIMPHWLVTTNQDAMTLLSLL
jgi:hypothetical protein